MVSFFAGIILVAIGLLYNHNKKLKQQKREASWKQNAIAGWIEYFLAWNIYHHELLAEVYRSWLSIGSYCDFGIYDEWFEDRSHNMYGRPAADEAVVRAKRIMIENGFTPYNKHWAWDDRRGCLTNLAIEMGSRPPEERGRDAMQRVDVQGWTNGCDGTAYETEIKAHPLYQGYQGHQRWILSYKKAGGTDWYEKVIYDPWDEFYMWPAYQKSDKYVIHKLKHPRIIPGDMIVDDIGVFPPPLPPPPPDPNKQVIINERNYDVPVESDDYISDWYSK